MNQHGCHVYLRCFHVELNVELTAAVDYLEHSWATKNFRDFCDIFKIKFTCKTLLFTLGHVHQVR